MLLLGSLFLTAFASALIPVINIEAILVGAQTQTEQWSLLLSLVAAAGQMGGKWLWFWGGQNVDRAPWVAKHMAKPKAQATLDKWQARTEGRPVFTTGVLLLSASVGFPPYAVISVLAGVLRVNLVLFLVTGLVGRTARFWAVLGGAAVVTSWF